MKGNCLKEYMEFLKKSDANNYIDILFSNFYKQKSIVRKNINDKIKTKF